MRVLAQYLGYFFKNNFPWKDSNGRKVTCYVRVYESYTKKNAYRLTWQLIFYYSGERVVLNFNKRVMGRMYHSVILKKVKIPPHKAPLNDSSKEKYKVNIKKGIYEVQRKKLEEKKVYRIQIPELLRPF